MGCVPSGGPRKHRNHLQLCRDTAPVNTSTHCTPAYSDHFVTTVLVIRFVICLSFLTLDKIKLTNVQKIKREVLISVVKSMILSIVSAVLIAKNDMKQANFN